VSVVSAGVRRSAGTVHRSAPLKRRNIQATIAAGRICRIVVALRRPILVALQDGRASTQRDLARFAKIEQPPMA
jgi:hypothetical protein